MKRIIFSLISVLFLSFFQSPAMAADGLTNNLYCDKESRSQSAPVPPDGFCPPPFFKPPNVNTCVKMQKIDKMLQWRKGENGAVEFAVSAIFEQGTCRISGVAQPVSSKEGSWTFKDAIYPGTPSEKTCTIGISRDGKGNISFRQTGGENNCAYICSGKKANLDGLKFAPNKLSAAGSAKVAYKKPGYFNHAQLCP